MFKKLVISAATFAVAFFIVAAASARHHSHQAHSPTTQSCHLALRGIHDLGEWWMARSIHPQTQGFADLCVRSTCRSQPCFSVGNRGSPTDLSFCLRVWPITFGRAGLLYDSDLSSRAVTAGRSRIFPFAGWGRALSTTSRSGFTRTNEHRFQRRPRIRYPIRTTLLFSLRRITSEVRFPEATRCIVDAKTR